MVGRPGNEPNHTFFLHMTWKNTYQCWDKTRCHQKIEHIIPALWGGGKREGRGEIKEKEKEEEGREGGKEERRRKRRGERRRKRRRRKRRRRKRRRKRRREEGGKEERRRKRRKERRKRRGERRRESSLWSTHWCITDHTNDQRSKRSSCANNIRVIVYSLSW